MELGGCDRCGNTGKVEPTTERELELIGALRSALGMFVGAMPISPSKAWQQAIDELGIRLAIHDATLGALTPISKALRFSTSVDDAPDDLLIDELRERLNHGEKTP